MDCSLIPELFKKYHVDRVPTFVLVKDGEEIHRICGNITLEYAANKLKSREK
jgi:thioredoxin-related protein